MPGGHLAAKRTKRPASGERNERWARSAPSATIERPGRVGTRPKASGGRAGCLHSAGRPKGGTCELPQGESKMPYFEKITRSGRLLEVERYFATRDGAGSPEGRTGRRAARRWSDSTSATPGAS